MMHRNCATPMGLIAAFIISVGCARESSTPSNAQLDHPFYPPMADAGSQRFHSPLPDFATVVPELVLRHGQVQGDAEELESISEIYDVVTTVDDAEPVAELKQCIAPLANSLQSANPQVRRQSALALDYVARNLGGEAEAAIDPLIKVVQRESTGPDQDASTFAMSALGFIGPAAERAVPLLVERLENANSPQTFSAAESLGRIQRKPEISIAALISALKPYSEDGKTILGRSEHEVLYEDVAIALGCFATEASSAAPRLLALLQSRSDRHQRKAFLQALCRMNVDSEQAIPLLVQMIQSSKARRSTLDDDVLPYAIDALCNLGEAGQTAAVDAMEGMRHVVLHSPGGRRWHLLNPCAQLVNEKRVVDVVAHIDSLEILQLTGEIEDSSLQPLSNATQLKQLYLPTKSNLANQGYLRKLIHLEVLRCGERPTVESLRTIASLPNLSKLIIPNSELTARDLDTLPEMPNLKSLDVYGIICSGEGLQNLAKFPSLEYLRLSFPRELKDADLQHLRNVPNLRELNVLVSSVGDAGMQHVGRLRELRRLGLYSTGVSDAGLMDLTSLVHLEFVGCGGSRVTRAGAERFRREMPNHPTMDFSR